jgi:Mor family transcriptional regulator
MSNYRQLWIKKLTKVMKLMLNEIDEPATKTNMALYLHGNVANFCNETNAERN